MIEAHSLTVALGGRPIVRSVDFRARPGEITAIIGPNGSGKTTLLRALTGELPATGVISLNGRLLNEFKPWQLAARRAVLPQSTTLSFPFTVREIVRLGVSAGLMQADRLLGERLPELALERVDLAGYAGRFYQELSGGEQQRVQLARVLCQVWQPVEDGEAKWLFLDEPVSSLDIRHQLDIMALARDYAAAGGGVVSVMHDLNLTAMHADSVAVMHEGRLLVQGDAGSVICDSVLGQAYGCELRVSRPPSNGGLFVLPQSVGAGD